MNEYSQLEALLENKKVNEVKQLIDKIKNEAGTQFYYAFQAKINLYQNNLVDAESNIESIQMNTIKNSNKRNELFIIKGILGAEVKIIKNNIQGAIRDLENLKTSDSSNELIQKKLSSILNAPKSVSSGGIDEERRIFLKLYREHSALEEDKKWYVVSID